MAERPDPEAMAWLLGKIGETKRSMNEQEREQPHVAIQIDPETGAVQVYGPYTDAPAAEAAIEDMREWHRVHTGPPALLYHAAIFFSPDAGYSK